MVGRGLGEPADFAVNLRIVQGKARRAPRSIPVDPARGNHVLTNRPEEVTMYPNTYFAQATVAVVAGVLVAFGSLGSGWSPTEFTFAVALAGHSCDVVVMTDTLYSRPTA